jgi:hypothetical protein
MKAGTLVPCAVCSLPTYTVTCELCESLGFCGVCSNSSCELVGGRRASEPHFVAPFKETRLVARAQIERSAQLAVSLPCR